MASHGFEYLQSAFAPGSSTSHAINATIVPNGCLGADLIANRVCDRLQGVTELVTTFGAEIRMWPASPRAFVYRGPCPALMVYLVGVDPEASPTESSLDQVEVFIGHLWRHRSLLPLPLYHPGPATVSTLIRATLFDDPNLSVTVNGTNIQLAQKTLALRESISPLAVSEDEITMLHEISQVYTVQTQRPTGQVRNVVQAS